jgi:hypothetical protein
VSRCISLLKQSILFLSSFVHWHSVLHLSAHVKFYLGQSFLPIAEECATLRCGVAVARTIYTHVRANACKKFDWKNDRGRPDAPDRGKLDQTKRKTRKGRHVFYTADHRYATKTTAVTGRRRQLHQQIPVCLVAYPN